MAKANIDTFEIGNGVKILSLIGRRASVNLKVPFAESLIIPELSADVKTAMAGFVAAPRSLQMGGGEGVNPGLTQGDVFPNEQTDYVYPKFRVLSAVLIPGYFIDFSKPNVLKESMQLLAEQTLYADHIYWRIREWVGVVNSVVWDEKPDKAGAPGINSEMKVDWRKAPDIARGLLMKPPAVRAVSATVDFEWDASHPDLLEKRIFWQSLGEEVDGEIVRLIVTKITDYYEVSFVYKGANPGSNGQLPADDDDDTGLSVPAELPSFGPGGVVGGPGSKVRSRVLPIQVKETKKVKLTPERKAALGLGAHEGEEVDDAVVLTAVDSLTARATAATAIIDAERAEVLRLATLAEGVGDDKKLPESLASIIQSADASQLPGLKTLYTERAAAQLKPTCQRCGLAVTSNRSSVEDQPVVGAGQSAPVARPSLL